MFPPMHLDEERNEEGEITKQGPDYYLKPMNCPMHILIFTPAGAPTASCRCGWPSSGRSTARAVRRFHGLTRVRGFTQDDAHIFCTRDQVTRSCARC